MPQLVTVRVRLQDGRRYRAWVPVVPVVLLLSPVVVLAVAGAVIACLIYRIDPARALSALWGVVCALPGARFAIEQGRTAVHVAIR
ncbi:MAG: hypothetical protein HOY71_35910 [Nonomuraea sp.]|nr:hypothetical protein [Nonomuraea sp.]